MAAEVGGYLLLYGVPCAYSLICLMGLVFNLTYAQTGTIYRLEPVGGFPDDHDDPAGTAQLTFWRTEPMLLRAKLKVQAYPRWAGIFLGGLPVVFFLVNGGTAVGIGLLCVILGIAAAVHFWKKNRQKADEHKVIFDLRFGWIWL